MHDRSMQHEPVKICEFRRALDPSCTCVRNSVDLPVGKAMHGRIGTIMDLIMSREAACGGFVEFQEVKFCMVHDDMKCISDFDDACRIRRTSPIGVLQSARGGRDRRHPQIRLESRPETPFSQARNAGHPCC